MNGSKKIYRIKLMNMIDIFTERRSARIAGKIGSEALNSGYCYLAA